LLAAAASLQSGSEHPLARAVVAAARERGLEVVQPGAVRAVAGRGTEGEVGGREYLIASLRWARELGVVLAGLSGTVARWQEEGATVSLLLERGPDALSVSAVMAFADEPKPQARAVLAHLRSRGLRLAMISGDNRAAVLSMAGRFGLSAHEVHADVLPGDKAAEVAALRAGGAVVAMVGDGVNDAPALAAADVGMAMGTGTDVAMHAAGVTLMRGDLRLVPAALDISDRTVRKIRQNLFWAFIYNVAGIPLAALGFLSPVMAGAAMALSSVSVMANALLLRRWHPPQD
jgi:P-type Cu+ transporter